MATSIHEERWRWLEPIIKEEMRLVDMAKVCPHSLRSLKRWKKAYEEKGVSGLIPKSTAPKTQPTETPIRLKEEVIALRKQTKLCAKKLHWRLKKNGYLVPPSTIGKILKQEGLTRKYRVKKITYKYVRATRQPGDLLEMDVKHVPGPIQGRKYFQYTVIDTASRWRHLEVFDEQATYHAIRMMEIVTTLFPYHIKALKTDNHGTFTNYYLGTTRRSDMTAKTMHALDLWCAKHEITHYLIDPGKPAQNGTVERSHREDQEKFYEQNTFHSLRDLKRKMQLWNDYYNNLEHCGLDGQTPNEVLFGKVPNVIG